MKKKGKNMGDPLMDCSQAPVRNMPPKMKKMGGSVDSNTKRKNVGEGWDVSLGPRS